MNNSLLLIIEESYLQTFLHSLDFGFVTDIPAKDAQGRTYNSFELESVALDQNNKLIAVCNANVKDATHTSGLASTDGFFQYNTLEFITT